MKNKEVSIIMAAFNAERTIEDSVRSVLTQTFTNWELIVVDDFSSDKTAEIVKNIARDDSRIRLYNNKQNCGIAGTRNIAMSHAQGGWLAFLDSDDIWHPTKLEKQLRFASETNAQITFTATSYINEVGQPYNYVLNVPVKFVYKQLLRKNLMSCSSVMVKRDVMVNFPQGFMHEDYVVWLQILRKLGCAYGLDQPLLIYRLYKGSTSGNRLKSAKMIYGSYRKVEYGRFKAMLLTLCYSVHSIIKRKRIKAGR